MVFPELRPALLTGFGLAFAREIGEYGSVIYISGNSAKEHTQVISYVIMQKLSYIDYASATAIALVMLVLPLISVIFNSLKEGLGFYMESISTEYVKSALSKTRGETFTLPLEIDALYMSGTDTSITAAFAVSSLLVLIAVVVLILRNIVEHRAKVREEGR